MPERLYGKWKCRDCISASMKKYYDNLKSRSICVKCKKPLPEDATGTICVTCLDKLQIIRNISKVHMIEYMGGKCSRCGFTTDTYLSVFEFHHVGKKDMDPSVLRGMKWESIVKELDKCVLVCANCHRILHYHSS